MKKLLTVLALFATIFATGQTKISGTIKDNAGKPIKGVVVSDGFDCTITNAKGKYKLTTIPDARYINYSIPAEYQVSNKDGHPDFYLPIVEEKKSYDFTLTKLPNGAEKQFKLIAMADPQVKSKFQIRRFEKEAITDIRTYVDAQNVPCYGVTLGDIAFSYKNFNTQWVMPIMREKMGYDHSHLLFFQTMGNHDCVFPSVTTDERSSNINLAFQREFERVFGPINYSWNRGKAHIISIKDIYYLDANKTNKIRAGISKEQFEWLVKDLSFVPKDKTVILCVHIGIYDRKSEFLPELRKLLAEYKESHILVGHTHFMNHRVNKEGTFEHVHAATCGAFWLSSQNSDGSPNGYTIYDIEGGHIKNWQYKGLGYDINFQIRVYRGDGEFGGDYEKFKFPYTHDTILANVFMADPAWKVELYEDGVLTSTMRRLHATKEFEMTTNSSKDWWSIGYLLGVIGRSHNDSEIDSSKMRGGSRKGYMHQCNHMYIAKLKNPDAKEIKVVAKDQNGNVYEQSHITENFDYSENEIMNNLKQYSLDYLEENY